MIFAPQRERERESKDGQGSQGEKQEPPRWSFCSPLLSSLPFLMCISSTFSRCLTLFPPPSDRSCLPLPLPLPLCHASLLSRPFLHVFTCNLVLASLSLLSSLSLSSSLPHFSHLSLSLSLISCSSFSSLLSRFSSCTQSLFPLFHALPLFSSLTFFLLSSLSLSRSSLLFAHPFSPPFSVIFSLHFVLPPLPQTHTRRGVPRGSPGPAPARGRLRVPIRRGSSGVPGRRAGVSVRRGGGAGGQRVP